MDIKNKFAVVSGATGGMGREICNALYSEGARLLIVARTEEKSKELSKELGNCDFIACDFTKPDEIHRTCLMITKKFPTIDFLMNVAGVGVYKSVEEVSEADWMDSFNINVTASYFFIKYLLPSLESSQKALVLNWGSGMGVIPTAGRSVYCTTKFALRGMSLSLSKEFMATNINIVHLTLGSVLTDFGPLTLKEKKEENLQGKAYFTPDWVAKRVVEIIKKDELKDEVVLYPTDYSEGDSWATNPK